MCKIAPYIIRHLQYENIENTNFTAFNEKGYYLVFWWKQIPLGHLYIEQNEKISSDELQQKILFTIKPVIDFYIHKSNPDQKFEQTLINKGSLSIKILEDIFFPYLPSSTPVKVNVSVVICTRNRSESLKFCLDSLHKQIYLPEEIIVVDNAPVDESTKIVVDQYPAVTYCREVRPGLDIARNTGAFRATCPIIAYTDDDVSLHPLWAYRIWETFLNADTAAMTGLVIATSLDTEAQQIFEKNWSFNRGYIDKDYNKNYFEKTLSNGPPVWEIGAGANMAFRKSVLKETGYFDERLDVGAAGCSGDSEIWFRILAKGFNIYYNPCAIAYHEHRKEISALNKQLFSYMRGHVVAALIQQAQYKSSGYQKHVFKNLPIYYLRLLIKGSPYYHSRYQTLFSEIRGVISGILYFNKHKHTAPSNQEPL